MAVRGCDAVAQHSVIWHGTGDWLVMESSYLSSNVNVF